MNPPDHTPRPLSPSEERAFEALDRAYEDLAGRTKPTASATTYSLGYEFRARLRRRGCPGDVLTRLNMGSASRADMTLAEQLLRPADPELADQVRQALAPEDTADHPVATRPDPPTTEAVFAARTMREKIAALEAQVAELEAELEDARGDVDAFQAGMGALEIGFEIEAIQRSRLGRELEQSRAATVANGEALADLQERVTALTAERDELERALALGQRTVDEHEETIDRMNRRLEAMPTEEAVVLQCDLIRGQHPGATVWVTYTTDTDLEDVAEDREPARWSVTIGMGGARVARAGATLKAAAGRASVDMNTVRETARSEAAGRRREDC